MSVALEQILGYVPLTEALRTNAPIPDLFPRELFTVAPSNRLLGDRAKYVRIKSDRRTQRRGKYGSPAVRRNLQDVGDQSVKMLHNFESFPIDFMVMQQLRSFEKYQQDQGMDWLRYQIEEAGRRQVNTHIIATASMLRYGAIYWDANGNLLPSSSGSNADQTISASIPASHQNQVNGLISAPWTLANTDIPSQINAMQRFLLEECGLEIDTALYGLNVAKYLRQNNFVQAFLSRNPGMNDQMVRAEIPPGLFGVPNWRPVYSTFYESDDAGTVSEIWNDDTIVFIPKVEQADKMRWWRKYEGSMPVPRSLDVQRDPMGAIKNTELVHGAGAYCVPTVNPPSAEIYHFDTFLPMICLEKAILQAVVAF